MNQERDVFHIDDANYKPYTHLEFKNDPHEFQFAVITDNAGTSREGVFAKAVEMVNWLQPEFVVHAGDLIEGYSDDEDQIRAWWQEIDGFLKPLEMPFFFLPGNHDVNTNATVKVWRERFGGEGRYYHFRYKDVLFLMVDTEDPPKQIDDLKRDNPELYEKVAKNYAAMGALQAQGESEDILRQMLALAQPIEEWLAGINITDAQVAYFEKVLKENADVRWTFCFVHAPPFYSPTAASRDPGNFVKIDSMMRDRPFTVFSAHTHTYHYDDRDGRDYITTATTGGMNLPRPGAMDHVVWVTMTKAGPKIVNLLMNGIMDKMGPPEDDDLEEIGLYEPRE